MKEVNKPMGQLAEVLGVLSVEVVVGEEVVVELEVSKIVIRNALGTQMVIVGHIFLRQM